MKNVCNKMLIFNPTLTEEIIRVIVAELGNKAVIEH